MNVSVDALKEHLATSTAYYLIPKFLSRYSTKFYCLTLRNQTSARLASRQVSYWETFLLENEGTLGVSHHSYLNVLDINIRT